jgi:hypothetical protein
MKFRTVSLAALALFLIGQFSFAQTPFIDGVQITTIKAPWSMRIPGQGLDVTKVLTKQDTTEKQWVEYCGRFTDFVGKNSSRHLIAIAFTRSLLPKTDRPLAIFGYQGTFEQQPSVIEIVGLLQEKNGNWVVTNYMPQ